MGNSSTTMVPLFDLASSLSEPSALLLIAGGFFIGIYAIIFGGGMFFSAPLIQWLFPGVTFGAVIGNIKVGAFIRVVGSTLTTHHHIDYWKTIQVSALAFGGTLLGALLISHLDQSWILPATILAIFLAEFGPRVAHLITPRTFHAASFLTGLYAGTFGAGIGILLVALFRLKYTADADIAHVKIQARFAELLLTVSAVFIHWFAGNLIPAIWIPFAIGSIAGGVVGGVFLRYMTMFSAKVQKIILRISYVLAIVTSAFRL